MADVVEAISSSVATYAEQQPAGWNKPCTEIHLATISEDIADWQAVSPHLGLTEAEETVILGSQDQVKRTIYTRFVDSRFVDSRLVD